MNAGTINKHPVKLFFDYFPSKCDNLYNTGAHMAELYGEVSRLSDKDLQKVVSKLEEFPAAFNTRVARTVKYEQKRRSELCGG